MLRDLHHLAAQHPDLSPELLADLRSLWSTARSRRYQDLGPIGQGAMGEVRRVRDLDLDRTLAMKIVSPRLLGHPGALSRFVEEAKATAQLQHPGIVPVHDLGTFPDGRLWFTMKEVQGRTLAAVIGELHAASPEDWTVTASGWSFRRLVATFLAVCRAVAYAHERGVVHRDLKPDNAMVGPQGEAYVLDWGLVKILAQPAEGVDAPAVVEDTVRSARPKAHRTRSGQVAGTPAYMPPEQARGEIHRIDARSDVYSLGAILYEILSGRPPYEGSAQAVLGQVIQGPPSTVGRGRTASTFGFWDDVEAVPESSGPTLPVELVEACERAMARQPEERFPTAAALADALQGWLDGTRRREQALALVRRAELAQSVARGHRARGGERQAVARSLLQGIPAWAGEDQKAPGWAAEEEAAKGLRAASLKELESEQALAAALQIEPRLPEAHAALAERYRRNHRSAEQARDRDAVARAGALLTAHAAALPEDHALRGELAAYLKGDGALTLHTDPPGAEVRLFRVVERNRRLVEVFEGSLGPTPLRSRPLPMGAYVCVLSHPKCQTVRYPVEISRQGHWDTVPPGESAPAPVWLPPLGSLHAHEIYVPAGWFRAGGVGPETNSGSELRLWCDAMVVDRYPVTNRDYIAFLDDLVAQGLQAEALSYAPRERAGLQGALGAPIYGLADGHFFLRPDDEGDLWEPDWPVVCVDHAAAQAFLTWRAQGTGRPLRLPGELEWEKAARGVDGRVFPWGDHLDPSWTRMARSARGRESEDFGPVAVDRYPVDTSVYGVRGCGGNVQEWCLDAYQSEPVHTDGRVTEPTGPSAGGEASSVVGRGGSWDAYERYARCAHRLQLDTTDRAASRGFRGLCRVAGLGQEVR